VNSRKDTKLRENVYGAAFATRIGKPLYCHPPFSRVACGMLRALSLFLANLSLLTFNTQASPLPVGAAAPQISAVDQGGKTIQFGDVYAKGITLVYFYPKSFTSGCTAEACSLRDSYEKLHAQGLQIIGVSRDNVDAQKRFQDQEKLPFTLVADTDGSVAKAFGVPMMMGGLIPVATRQSFIVKDDKIAWNSLKAQTSSSAQEVQKALDSLK
jgi:peroxiredoxin Q/BCP